MKISGRLPKPGLPEGCGFAFGTAVLASGLYWQARRRQLRRIERKLDEVRDKVDS